MKSRLLLIPAIVATTAAFGVSGNAFSEPRDAQAQAAALLSRPHTPEPLQTQEQRNARSSSTAVDAHASAAALLTGQGIGGQKRASAPMTPPTVARKPVDAHAHAAALLSGSRIVVHDGSRMTAIGDPLGEHPAVLVAQQWTTRGIDPNEFIAAHPARLQLIEASPTQEK